MIQMQTNLEVADNSGAKRVQCIKVLGGFRSGVTRASETSSSSRSRRLKLGYGRIREIEFVIQPLQLIYAGRDKSLREKNALKALHMLSQKGLIPYQEHAALAKA